MTDYYLGIDIGGTQIKWGIVDSRGNLLEQELMDTEDTADQSGVWKNKILGLIESQYRNFQQRGNQLYCGLSAPGLADSQNQMILHMPGRLKGIENLNWSVVSKQHVSVLNDGHAAALAEYETHYRQKGVRNFLMLTLGTGVGGGVIINGELYQGFAQRAGHIGHMTLDSEGPPTMTNMPGSLEYYIGNFSVEKRTHGNFANSRELVEAYLSGNKKAAEYWLASVNKLAVGLASLNNILAPEVIVLGGGISAGAGTAILEPLKAAIANFEWRPGGQQVNIQLAKSAAHAGALGAALFAMKQNKS